MHVHSVYSDGTFTPAEILALAEGGGVSLLAIADHDVTNGSEELCKLAVNSPVKCIPAIELNAFDYGVNIHVLAYDYSFRDAEFKAFAAQNRRKLDSMSDRLVEVMERAGEPVSVAEYNNFEYDRRGGGWKALHYFKAKGLTTELLGGSRLYPKFGVGYDTAGFPSVAEVCAAIHRAGAVAVLAHPGVTFENDSTNDLKTKLGVLAEQGIDGIECFYPEHSAETTVICSEFCGKHNLYKTCGSDCHGSFTGANLGSLPVTTDQLNLPKCILN
jgi:Predicted metal-dependent phosphoesterases (PHP family)